MILQNDRSSDGTDTVQLTNVRAAHKINIYISLKYPEGAKATET